VEGHHFGGSNGTVFVKQAMLSEDFHPIAGFEYFRDAAHIIIDVTDVGDGDEGARKAEGIVGAQNDAGYQRFPSRRQKREDNQADCNSAREEQQQFRSTHRRSTSA